MSKTCLNCKWEPVWGEEFGGVEYPRRSGKCNKVVLLPILPETYAVREAWVIKHSDDSGVMSNCRTWEQK